MNKIRLVGLAAFLGVFGLAQAQHQHEDTADGGAMHQMMMTPFVLPALQSELGLSAQQVTRLGQLKQELLTKGKETSAQIAAKRKELDGLLAAGSSKAGLVKRLYEEIGTLRGQLQYAAYETSLKMKAELTDGQRNKLAGMKPHELHQATMSRMTMSDMMEMMPFMGGEGMMGGMMGGMMNGMMMGGMMMGQGHMMMREGMMGAPKQ